MDRIKVQQNPFMQSSTYHRISIAYEMSSVPFSIPRMTRYRTTDPQSTSVEQLVYVVHKISFFYTLIQQQSLETSIQSIYLNYITYIVYTINIPINVLKNLSHRLWMLQKNAWLSGSDGVRESLENPEKCFNKTWQFNFFCKPNLAWAFFQCFVWKCLETQLKGGTEHSPQNIQGTLWLAQLYLVDHIAQIR